MSAPLTARSTLYEPLLITLIWADEDVELLDEAAEAGRAVAADPRLEPEPPDPLALPGRGGAARAAGAELLADGEVDGRRRVDGRHQRGPVERGLGRGQRVLGGADARGVGAELRAEAPAEESSLYLACAWARSASAWPTAAASLVESIVASTWPAFTVSPAFTLTAVTVPLDEKLRSSVAAAAISPSAEIVWSSDPVVAVTTSSVGNAAAAEVEPELDRVKNQ
jgi:hypothetical protein